MQDGQLECQIQQKQRSARGRVELGTLQKRAHRTLNGELPPRLRDYPGNTSSIREKDKIAKTRFQRFSRGDKTQKS